MSKQRIIIVVKQPTRRTGPYSFQGSKTVFDNRPKRIRTRATQKGAWKKEYE